MSLFPKVELEIRGRVPGLSAARLADLAATAAGLTGRRRPFRIGVVVASEATIRRLNRQYRGQDRVTDVLSFRLADGPAIPVGEERAPSEDLGDIFICPQQVRRQAKAAGRSVTGEFALMVVHGTLHLLGYDHLTVSQERRMFAYQRRALNRLGYL